MSIVGLFCILLPGLAPGQTLSSTLLYIAQYLSWHISLTKRVRSLEKALYGPPTDSRHYPAFPFQASSKTTRFHL